MWAWLVVRASWVGRGEQLRARPFGACRCIESSNRPDAVTTQGLATSGLLLLKAIAIAEQLRRARVKAGLIERDEKGCGHSDGTWANANRPDISVLALLRFIAAAGRSGRKHHRNEQQGPGRPRSKVAYHDVGRRRLFHRLVRDRKRHVGASCMLNLRAGRSLASAGSKKRDGLISRPAAAENGPCIHESWFFRSPWKPFSYVQIGNVPCLNGSLPQSIMCLLLRRAFRLSADVHARTLASYLVPDRRRIISDIPVPR